MKYRIFITLNLMVSLFFSVSSHARSKHEDSELLLTCEKLGGKRTVLSQKIIDFSTFTTGKNSDKVCVYEISCSIPQSSKVKAYYDKGNYYCEVMPDGDCDDVDSCATKMPKSELGVTSALVAPAVSKQQCTNDLPKALWGRESKGTEQAMPICLQEPKCMTAKGSVQHPMVACAPNRLETRKADDGNSYDYPVCPAPADCLENKIQLPNPTEYKAELRKKKNQLISDTNPRNSTPATSVSSSRGHGSR